MRWLELTVETHPEAIESVSELLSQYTPGGVAIEEPFELIDEGTIDSARSCWSGNTSRSRIKMTCAELDGIRPNCWRAI